MHNGGTAWTYWIGLVSGLASRCGSVFFTCLSHASKLYMPSNDELLSLFWDTDSDNFLNYDRILM